MTTPSPTHLLCIMKVQLSAEVVLYGRSTCPVMNIAILILEIGCITVKDRVISSLLFEQLY